MIPSIANAASLVTYRVLPEVPGYGRSDQYVAGNDGSMWTKGNSIKLNCMMFAGVRYKRLKGSITNRGYRCYGLRLGNRYWVLSGHRLTLLTFRGPCPEGMEVRHLNGDKLDNRVENLEYGTHQQNMDDKINHGTLVLGERIVQAKLKDEDIPRIRELIDYGVPTSVPGRIFGVSHARISNIMSGANWSHIA